MNKILGIIRSFDLYGEDVAPINMRGESKHTSVCGGSVGMVVYGLILWFLYARIKQLTTKENPNFFKSLLDSTLCSTRSRETLLTISSASVLGHMLLDK